MEKSLMFCFPLKVLRCIKFARMKVTNLLETVHLNNKKEEQCSEDDVQ